MRCLGFLVVVAILLAVCGGGGSSTPSSPTPAPAPTPSPAPAPAPAPTPQGALQVVDTPNPAPWASAPVAPGNCSALPNNWSYNTILTETGGAAVTVTSSTNIVDGNTQPDIAGEIQIPARGSVTRMRQFCFSGPASDRHTIQTTWRH